MDEVTKEVNPEEINPELELLKKQSAEYLTGWQTERANFLNYQQSETERLSKMLVLSERNILMEILEVMGNFDLLLKNLKSEEALTGIKLVYDQLVSFLNRHQCFAFESLNQIFDPNLHEALETVQDETKNNNTVIEEIQKGYKLDNVVIRPAKVKVIINQNKN